MKALPLSLCLVTLISLNGYAQEQSGLRFGNFAGVNGWAINPSAHTTTPYNWEVNLLEGTAFFDNNYAYFRQTRLLSFARKPNTLQFAFAPDYDKENPVPPGSIALDFFDDNSKRYAFGQASVMGPAFFVRLNPNHTVGLFTRVRAFASGRGVVNDLSYYRYFNRPFYEPFQVQPFRMGMAAWAELGLNYLYQTETANGHLGIGISGRYLQSWEGIYLRNHAAFPLAKLPGDTLRGGPIHFEYAYTTSNLAQEGRRIQPNGSGWAFDLGMTYTIGEPSDYEWRLGFSLLDVGRLNFSRQARAHRVRTADGESIIGFDDYDSFAMPQELEPMLQLFSTHILGNPAASAIGARFGLWLPAAFSVQADRKLAQGLYVQALWVQGLPVPGAALQRGSLLAVTPRWEKRWLELAMPVSLYQGRRLQMGLAGRLGPLTLGTDRLGSIFAPSRFSGTDVYLAFKITPFKLQSAGKDKDPRDRGGYRNAKAARARVGGGAVRCYRF